MWRRGCSCCRGPSVKLPWQPLWGRLVRLRLLVMYRPWVHPLMPLSTVHTCKWHRSGLIPQGFGGNSHAGGMLSLQVLAVLLGGLHGVGMRPLQLVQHVPCIRPCCSVSSVVMLGCKLLS